MRDFQDAFSWTPRVPRGKAVAAVASASAAATAPASAALPDRKSVV